MRIGELARELGVSTHAVRFYERAGWLPRPARADNGYRAYADDDLEHLRLLIDLRRMDLPLNAAARLAGWCHSGHCEETSGDLPRQLSAKRSEIAERIDGLRQLDARLADLERHLAPYGSELNVLASGGPCCSAAAAVEAQAEGGCACCAAGSGAHT